MPEKRAGYTQVSVQVPDDLLAAAHAKRGERSINAMLCLGLAKLIGERYEPKRRGRPKEGGGVPSRKRSG